jgi:hypothetical protein
MTLGEQQRVFTMNVALLILWGYGKGYEMSFGETLRSNEQALINAMGPAKRTSLVAHLKAAYPKLANFIADNTGSGVSPSLHELRLAVDLNLFRGGHYLTDTQSHAPLGAFWKTLHPLNRWGGDFANADGNHYSMEYAGIK